jgi:hypothetical protein
MSYRQQTDSKMGRQNPFPVVTSDETTNSSYDFCSGSAYRDSEIIRQAMSVVCSTRDNEVKDQSIRLLATIQKVIESLQRQGVELFHLPPLRAVSPEDDSMLIEWIFPDFRVGFSIERDESDSSWYLVSNRRLEDESGSGNLSRGNLEKIVVSLLRFMLSNS